eukprot:TRINITY_DN11436_c0_g1_i7.p1 TRINITY_DN11436_c0_g1~~TRINITY_DN11436_c0_g1_i7.p1  ORF type:complete len:1037 (+),score=146.90 TRINITY_DN11436_c0_g1_i7:46-3111(+)
MDSATILQVCLGQDITHDLQGILQESPALANGSFIADTKEARFPPIMPLQAAAFANNTNSCRALIQAGAKIDCFDEQDTPQFIRQRDIKDPFDRVPIFALPHQLWPSVPMLDLEDMLVDSDDDEPLNEISRPREDDTLGLMKHGANRALVYQAGLTPLQLACFNGHLDIAIILLDAGAEINNKGTAHLTPLHLASHAGRERIVALLLRKGANIDERDDMHRSALCLAIMNDHVATVSLLTKAGAKLDSVEKRVARSQTNDGVCTALCKAVREASFAVVKLLVELGADPNAVEAASSRTPLQEAAARGSLDVIEYLLDDARTNDQPDTTALHLAVRHQHVAVAKALIDRGADVKDTESCFISAAAYNGDKAMMDLLLARGASESSDAYQTPLMCAIDRKHHSVAELLLKSGADPNATTGFNPDCPDTDYGLTALHMACSNNDLEGAKLLLSAEANPNIATQIEEWTPLTLAMYSSEALVQLLLAWGAAPEYGSERQPIIVAAAELESSKLVALLLEAARDGATRHKMGAAVLEYWMPDVDLLKVLLKANSLDFDCKILKQILRQASQRGGIDFIQLLLDFGMDANTRLDTSGTSMLKLACANDHAHLAVLLLNNGASANLLGGRPGFAPLHHAAANQNAPLISLLLARGAEVDARNELGQTALHFAVGSQSLAVTRALLQYQPNLNVIDQNGDTLLHEAALPRVIKYLVKRGANIDAVNQEGLTPLIKACQDERHAAVEALLKHGADPTLVVPDLCTPLHWAAAQGKAAIARRLLAKGLGIYLTMSAQYSRRPLHLAAKNGHLKLVKILLERREKSLKDPDANGHTALHLASTHGHQQVVDFLLAQGDDFEARDVFKRTPLMLATQHRRHDVVKSLLQAGASVKAVSKHKHAVFRFLVNGSQDHGEDRGLALTLLEHGAEALPIYHTCSFPEELFVPYQAEHREWMLRYSWSDDDVWRHEHAHKSLDRSTAITIVLLEACSQPTGTALSRKAMGCVVKWGYQLLLKPTTFRGYHDPELRQLM